MALVVLSKVEQRLDAVRAVLGGAQVTEVAAAVGVSRQTRACVGDAVSAGGGRRAGGPVAPAAVVSASDAGGGAGAGGGAAAAASAVGGEADPDGAAEEAGRTARRCPATATINRILIRQGLVAPRKRKRPQESYKRWERPGPMQLWQLDIVGGVWLVDPVDR